MFDSQPLGCVICSNYIDYNLIILIFEGDVLINFDPPPPVPICSHCGDPLPPRVGTSLMDAPLRVKDLPKVPTWRLEMESNQRPSAPKTPSINKNKSTHRGTLS